MISIRQSQNGNKDPVLHVTITENQAYLNGAVNLTDVEDAIARISRWIKKKVEVNNANMGSPLDNSMAETKRRRAPGDFESDPRPKR